MTKLRIILLLAVLALVGARTEAALFGGGEAKAYGTAKDSYRLKAWERAEQELAEFIKEYPKSEQVAEAVWYQAQAQFEQRKYDAAVALLQARVGQAGNLTDQYLYWLGQAHFAVTNYPAAAATFAKLAGEHPTSPRRLEAAVNQAAALARLEEWTNVVTLLKRADGPFRQAELGARGTEMASRGFLLLAEAQLMLKDYPSVEVALTRVGAGLSPDLEWKRRNVLCRMLAESGRAEDAARESDGMIAAAENAVQNPNRLALIADSVVFQADLFEQLGQKDKAIVTLRRNFTNAPVARQRQALVRVAALAIQQEQVAEAMQTLEAFLNQFTNAAAADVAWLTLGELHLKQHVGVLKNSQTEGGAGDHLAAAADCFQKVITRYPGSLYIGKARLNLGWCFWVENKFAESELAFDTAVKRLPLSEDRAVAQFKLADAQFAQSNYVAALTNYREVLQVMTNWPAVNGALRTPASYQALRASLELTNAAGAEQAMRAILADDSASAEAISSVLLVAQAYVDADEPIEAQRLFGEFTLQFPESDLRPEVELLVARLREEQGQWAKAGVAYDAWLGRYGTNRLRAQVEFQRALAAAGAGDWTNALQRFTNFAAQYPTHELAPRAQWWVADYFYGREDFVAAEINYKELFTRWPKSELAFEAQMMAGRAAVGRSGYDDAIEHFTSLTLNTNCPPVLWGQAMSAYGGALMRQPPKGTNKLENLEKALTVYKELVRVAGQRFPTNELTAAAMGELGNCAAQLQDYATATNAYQQALLFPGASGTIRSQARVGLAIVLEKQATPAGAPVGTELLKQARELYRDVYQGKFLSSDEVLEAFWKKKAGLEAARLSELLNEWPQAIELYRDLNRQKLLSASELELKVAGVERRKRATEKSEGTAI
jgi:TolA-binding protein